MVSVSYLHKLLDSLFDAANLSTGIYIYSLKSGGFLENKKMLLIK